MAGSCSEQLRHRSCAAWHSWSGAVWYDSPAFHEDAQWGADPAGWFMDHAAKQITVTYVPLVGTVPPFWVAQVQL